MLLVPYSSTIDVMLERKPRQDGRHTHDRHHSNDDSKDGEKAAKLVGTDGIQRHSNRFGWKCRLRAHDQFFVSATMGSSRDAFIAG